MFNSAKDTEQRQGRSSYTFSAKLLQKQPAQDDLEEELRQIDASANRNRIRQTFAGKLALIIKSGKQKDTSPTSEGDEINDERHPNSHSHAIANLAGQLDIEPQLLECSQIVLNIKEFTSTYETLESLGEGCIAVVKRVQNRTTGQQFAAKMVKTTSDEILKNIVVEFRSLLKLHHENIVRMETLYLRFDGHFQGEHQAIIIMELVNGSEMFQVLNQLGHYNEGDARTLFQQLLCGIQHLHQNAAQYPLCEGYPFYLQWKDTLKITDFNVSKFVDAQKEFGALKDVLEIEMWTYTGTIAYSAPERFEGGKYNELVDMWSAGCILYSMLSGLLPFHGDYLHDLINEIQHKEITFQEPNFLCVSQEAKDLISRLLEKDPNKRISCLDALSHKWLRDDLSRYTLKNFSLTQSIQQLTKNDNILKYKVILSQVSSSSRFGSMNENKWSDQCINLNGAVRKKTGRERRTYKYQPTPGTMELQESIGQYHVKNHASEDGCAYRVTEEQSGLQIFP